MYFKLIVGTKPLRERIDALLAVPEQEALALPFEELRAMLLTGIELFRDQQHFLSGRKAQLM